MNRLLPFLLFSISAALLTTGCTVGPDYEKPNTACLTPAAWSAGSGIEVQQCADLGHWWKRLKDPTLDDLISQAIKCNRDLKIAGSRVRQSIAVRHATAGSLFPSLSTAHAATRIQNSRAGLGGNAQPRVYEIHSHGFESAWELDVFGGIRRSIEGAEADIETAEANLRDALVSVISEVALNYIDLRSFQMRIDIARTNLKSQRETQSFVQSRFEAGLIEELEVQQAISNVENTRAQIPSLETSATAAKNRIATLLGVAPQKLNCLSEKSGTLPHVPTRIAVGIPASTIRCRPDVQAAERTLAAETARTGVAIAELYPKFRLNGSIGVEALKFSSLFDGGADVFRIGPAASWNLFSGCTIRANIEAQNAVQEQALLSYEQSILIALEEVENSLTALANEQIRERALARSATATARSATIARSRYEDGGITTFLEVLDAERSRLTAEDTLAVSRAQIVSNLVQLYRALGGGWECVQPNSRKSE